MSRHIFDAEGRKFDESVLREAAESIGAELVDCKVVAPPEQEMAWLLNGYDIKFAPHTPGSMQSHVGALLEVDTNLAFDEVLVSARRTKAGLPHRLWIRNLEFVGLPVSRARVGAWTCDNHATPIHYTDGTERCYCGEGGRAKR